MMISLFTLIKMELNGLLLFIKKIKQYVKLKLIKIIQLLKDISLKKKHIMIV